MHAAIYGKNASKSQMHHRQVLLELCPSAIPTDGDGTFQQIRLLVNPRKVAVYGIFEFTTEAYIRLWYERLD